MISVDSPTPIGKPTITPTDGPTTDNIRAIGLPKIRFKKIVEGKLTKKPISKNTISVATKMNKNKQRREGALLSSTHSLSILLIMFSSFLFSFQLYYKV
jgi:hypothetical protein